MKNYIRAVDIQREECNAMRDFESFSADELAQAMKSIAISDKQKDELRSLYSESGGFPFVRDSQRRPRGKTIHTCSLVGSNLKRSLGTTRGDGMMMIGLCDHKDDTWHMKPRFRAALDILGWIESQFVDQLQEYQLALQERIESALSDSTAARRARLAKASRIPKKIQVTTYVYARNEDVIAEVLAQAQGICQRCGDHAPFVKKTNLQPYLEVHHRVRLSDGGEDTVENAIALCPNCHRETHFG